MNHLPLSTLAAFALVACSEPVFNVSGVAEDGQVVYLSSATEKIDSTVVSGGKFSFVVSPTESPALMVATVAGSRNGCQFIADGTDVELNLTTGTLKGSDVNNVLNSYQEAMRRFFESYRSAAMAYEIAPSDKRDSLKAVLASTEREMNEYFVSSYEKAKGTFLGCVFLQNVMYEMEPSELAEAVKAHSRFAGNSVMERPAKLLASYDKRAVGKDYTDFSMPDTAGVSHSLSEWIGEGKYVLVDFWASWCGPCRREMPNVLANYEKYHSKGLEVVGVSFDSDHRAWTDAINNLGLVWPHISDLKGWNSLGANLYGIRSIPSNVLIGPDGKIVASDLREDALGEKLKAVFGE